MGIHSWKSWATWLQFVMLTIKRHDRKRSLLSGWTFLGMLELTDY